MKEGIKIAIQIIAVTIISIATLAAVIASMFVLIDLFTFPKCIEHETQYAWTSWAGNTKRLGTDMEEALKLAGDKPIHTFKHCINWD